jgi:serine protease Do
LSQSERRSLNINYGVKVAELNDGRFKDIGIRRGYIILSINGKKVSNAAEVRQASDNESDLESIEGVQSNGTYFSYQFRN